MSTQPDVARDGREPVNTLEGTAEEQQTLVAVMKAAFPHQHVPDSAYERVAKQIAKEAGEDTWMRVKVAQGLDSLQALAQGTFHELDPRQALRVLLRVQDTAWFGFVRQTTVVNLYEDEEVWEALGYEGPSFDKGGYIDRGFDDLDWLPDPRVEEYDGEPLGDIVSDLPGSAGAAQTRGAAVPAGQTKAQGQRTDTGRADA